MRSLNKASAVIVLAVFVSVAVPWQSSAQDTKSGVVNSRDKILDATSSKQNQFQAETLKAPPGPGTLPCNSKTNPKCPASKSKPGE